MADSFAGAATFREESVMLTEQLILDTLVAEAAKRGGYEADNGWLKTSVEQYEAGNSVLRDSNATLKKQVESLTAELRRVVAEGQETINILRSIVDAAGTSRRKPNMRNAIAAAQEYLKTVIPF